MTNTNETLTIGQLFDNSIYSIDNFNKSRLYKFLSCFELSFDSTINDIKATFNNKEDYEIMCRLVLNYPTFKFITIQNIFYTSKNVCELRNIKLYKNNNVYLREIFKLLEPAKKVILDIPNEEQKEFFIDITINNVHDYLVHENKIFIDNNTDENTSITELLKSVNFTNFKDYDSSNLKNFLLSFNLHFDETIKDINTKFANMEDLEIKGRLILNNPKVTLRTIYAYINGFNKLCEREKKIPYNLKRLDLAKIYNLLKSEREKIINIENDKTISDDGKYIRINSIIESAIEKLKYQYPKRQRNNLTNEQHDSKRTRISDTIWTFENEQFDTNYRGLDNRITNNPSTNLIVNAQYNKSGGEVENSITKNNPTNSIQKNNDKKFENEQYNNDRRYSI